MDVTATGSAARQGPLWGERAEDWAANEEMQRPTYAEALRRTGIGAGSRVLDVGCGSGVFLEMAAAEGAQVSGLDAAQPLLDIARRRVPGADLRRGDMQFLPFEDGAFDVVCGFNSFFFADDMVAALREAGRVARAGGTVVAQVWGRPDRCDLTHMKTALSPYAPPPPAGAPELWREGVLEELARAAGLEPREAFAIRYPMVYADRDALGRQLVAPGVIVGLAQQVGEAVLRDALVAAMERFRRPDGSYRVENEWRFLLAGA